MFKKSLIVVAAVAAMALPAAALGDGGAPADPGAKIAAIQAKLDTLKAKCTTSPEAQAKCAKVAAKVLDRLNKISARIDDRESKINAKCSVATPPAKCSEAPALLAKLDAAKAAIAQLESYIQSNFPAPTAG